ncbi:MAG TPA: CHAT domain-containing protein, partial [Thermoanaerobaculia bacterium]
MRAVQGRFSGAAWAPYKGALAGRRARSPEGNVVRGSLAQGSNASAGAQTSAAETTSLDDFPSEADESPRTAQAWNDLAVSLISRSQASATRALLVQAIAATDAALELQPRFPEALFNRALAIEQLGLRDLAADGWRQYLAVEPTGAWADEARSRLASVSVPISPLDHRAKAAFRAALLDGDATAATRFVQTYEHAARTYVEVDVFGAWGTAYGNDAAAARDELKIARAIARELAGRGDPFIADCTSAIDAASDNQRAVLAQAHKEFARGRTMMRGAPTKAEAILRNAAALFARTESPMSLFTRYCVATSVQDQNQRSQAERALEASLRELPARYRTLRAQILWQLALAYGARSQWGDAIAACEEGAAIFDAVGEPFNAAFLRVIQTEILEQIGGETAAEKLRESVLPVFGRMTTARTASAIAAISYPAAQRKQWRTAVSMLNLELDILSRIKDPTQQVDASLRRAVAHYSLQRHTAAYADLKSAKAATASLEDPAQRQRAEADVLVAEVLLGEPSAPSAARLTAAIEFHETSGMEMYLPALYLQRGRALAATGNADAAQRDFERGIERLERDRATLPDIAARLWMFDTAEELFIAAVENALDRGDTARAFDYAERGRARTLLDALGTAGVRPPPVDFAAVPANTALVELVSLSHDIAAFVLTQDGLSDVRIDHKPTVIAAAAKRFRERLVENDAFAASSLGRSLHARLIAPLLPLVGGRTDLVFIPNVETAAIPFAALQSNDGRPLLENYAVRIAPSTATFLQLRPAESRLPRNALVIAASSPDNMTQLPDTDVEARRVAAQYPGAATLLMREDAEARALLRQIKDADIVHFGGHGQSTADNDASTALVMSSGSAITRQAIESLRLPRTQLVVLAACNSARGEENWSEGTLSTARAFLTAGVPTVIATLWPISDEEAAEFFPAVHAKVARGLSPSQALRATQLEWLQSNRATPSMWAAIQVIG